jgi:hypothetical protein
MFSTVIALKIGWCTSNKTAAQFVVMTARFEIHVSVQRVNSAAHYEIA